MLKNTTLEGLVFTIFHTLSDKTCFLKEDSVVVNKKKLQKRDYI